VLAGGCESHSVAGPEAARLRAALEDDARRHAVQAHVVITGYLPEARISRLLQAADVAAFPFDDGVTMKSSSLLAALGHDVPTVATWPDRRDAPTDDAVLWIPPRDTGALVAAIERVLADAALSERMRRAGRAVIARRGWPQAAALHAAIYGEVLAEAAGPTLAAGRGRASFVRPGRVAALVAREAPAHGAGGPREQAEEDAADDVV
jgi:glycosyltransferase involved in cell wall biosynthesis